MQLAGSSERALNVTQYHFTAWPDHGVPEYATPLLALHKKMRKRHRPSRGPILVHCRYIQTQTQITVKHKCVYFSAGVGRTGTFIAIDCVLDQVKKERIVDIAGTIIHLRSQRMKMVQSLVCSCNVKLHYAVCSALCPICRTMYGHVHCGFSRNYNILSQSYSTLHVTGAVHLHS